MDEILIAILALAFGGLVIAAVVVLVVLLIRTNGLVRRVSEVEGELRLLRARREAPVAPVASPAAPQAPAPVVERPRAPDVAPAPPPIAGIARELAPPPSVVPTALPGPKATPSTSSTPHAPSPAAGSAWSSAPTVPASSATPSAPPAPQREPARPVAAPVFVPPPPPTQKARVPIEKILGVTGAAVLGGIVLAIAGFYLYQYSVQQGWVTKEVRLAMGIVTGIACLVASGPLRKRDYAVTSDALTGGGVVILYAAFWAGHQVFGVWPVWVSFAAMVATTVVCCTLAYRRSSQLIAALGLVGGFATPLVLSTGSDHPIGLFGYTLLVNLGFLSVARQRRWPMIGSVALLGTLVIEGAYIFLRAGPDTYWVALVVLPMFALVFGAFVLLQPVAERKRGTMTLFGAAAMPFAFSIYFAARNDPVIGFHLYPMACVAAVILACGGWLARRPVREGEPRYDSVPLGTAVGCVAIAIVWVTSRTLESARVWELAVCCIGLALVQHAHLELVRARASRGAAPGGFAQLDGARASSAGLVLGLLLPLLLAAFRDRGVELTPWLVASGVLVLLAARQAAITGREWLAVAAAVPAALTLVAWTSVNARATGWTLGDPPLVGALCLAIVPFAACFLRKGERARAMLAHATLALLVGGVVAYVLAVDVPRDARVEALFSLALLTLPLPAIARLTGPIAGALWLAVGALFTAGGEMAQIRDLSGPEGNRIAAVEALALMLASAAAFTGLFGRRERVSAAVARVRAACVLLWSFPLRAAWDTWTLEEWRGVPALLLAALAFGAWRWSASARGPDPSFIDVSSADAHAVRIARIWSTSVALALALASTALEVDRQWGLVAPALAAGGLAWIARRERHAPLAIIATALLVASTLGLTLGRTGAMFTVYPHAFLNELVWLYLAPAAAGIVAARMLGPMSVVSPTTSSTKDEAWVWRWSATTCGVAAVVLVFAWLNLAILDAFAKPPSFRLPLERYPIRDLTLSLAWAVYALVLLVLGVTRSASGLRWISLILFLLTIGKVFLGDLGHLTGLYRVGSLFGLALALLAVSMLYQRFVFRRLARPEPTPPPPPSPEAQVAPDTSGT